jgi:hypothetical protein
LAEQQARWSSGTYRNYETIIHLLKAYMERYWPGHDGEYDAVTKAGGRGEGTGRQPAKDRVRARPTLPGRFIMKPRLLNHVPGRAGATHRRTGPKVRSRMPQLGGTKKLKGGRIVNGLGVRCRRSSRALSWWATDGELPALGPAMRPPLARGGGQGEQPVHLAEDDPSMRPPLARGGGQRWTPLSRPTKSGP